MEASTWWVGVPERPWLRGPATYRDGWIALNAERGSLYSPYQDADLAFAFAHLARGGADEAVAFVQRFGLLSHGPEDEVHRERLEDIQREARVVELLLTTHAALQRAVAGDTDAVTVTAAFSREYLEPLLRERGLNLPVGEQPRLEAVAGWIAEQVTHGLAEGDVREALASAVGTTSWSSQPTAADFVITADARDLLGYIYHHLATLFVSRARTRACEACGQFFTVADRRQRFCSTTCSNRKRYRRWKDKQSDGSTSPRGTS